MYGVTEGKPGGEGGRTTAGRTVARTRPKREREDTHALCTLSDSKQKIAKTEH